MLALFLRKGLGALDGKLNFILLHAERDEMTFVLGLPEKARGVRDWSSTAMRCWETERPGFACPPEDGTRFRGLPCRRGKGPSSTAATSGPLQLWIVAGCSPDRSSKHSEFEIGFTGRQQAQDAHSVSYLRSEEDRGLPAQLPKTSDCWAGDLPSFDSGVFFLVLNSSTVPP